MRLLRIVAFLFGLGRCPDCGRTIWEADRETNLLGERLEKLRRADMGFPDVWRLP